MKRIINKILLVAVILAGGSCSKDMLDIKNTNEPTLDRLNSEAGIKQGALGVYGAVVTPEGNWEGGLSSFNLWFALTNHEIMGDAAYVPYGNFGWRWINQVDKITLDDGTIINHPVGGSQGEEMVVRNTRELGDDNPLKGEWLACYSVNNSANLVLDLLAKNEIALVGNAEVKKATLSAWAHFWKAWTYSRIGSFYSAGLIIDAYGRTNGDFVSHDAMITEANAEFDLALAELTSIDDEEAYMSVMNDVIPALALVGQSIPSPDEWVRNINTMKARNLLVNKKRKDMTPADWNGILTLANSGILDGDFIFVLTEDADNVSTSTVSYRACIGWVFTSERLVQDYKPGDDRFARYFTTMDPPLVNQRGRGIQFGTRWDFVAETDLCATTVGGAYTYLAGTYEENELMKAEAKIFLGQVEDGLGHIDAVRTSMNAQLAAVKGTGLTEAQAKEELRSERRVAMLFRGLAFYDARRWGVIDPVSGGGGRTGCVVLAADGTLNTNATFDYNYLDYYPVPANELDFNAGNEGSAATGAIQ